MCGLLYDRWKYPWYHSRPSSIITASQKLSLVPRRVPTTLPLDSQSHWSLCLSFLGSFVLELTVLVWTTLILVSAPRPGMSRTQPIALGSVSTRLSHRMVCLEGYRPGWVLKLERPRFQPWCCLLSAAQFGKPLDLLEFPLPHHRVELRKPTLWVVARLTTVTLLSTQ